MKKKLDFVLREIAGDLLLVPTGKTALNGRGGGKPNAFQGNFKASHGQITAYFRDLL